jgi:membrane protein DedA with SNARE-associated domain
MALHFSASETQTTLALSVFLLTLAYEDGATLLAATLAGAGRLDVRLGFASAFLGIWAGDMGLYLAGATLGRRVTASRWLVRVVSTQSLDRAESWFRRRGPLTIVMSRFLPGSRLPLYLAAGAFRVPAELFGIITGVCAAVWVSAIFLLWRLAPAWSATPGTTRLWFLAAFLLVAPWLLNKGLHRLWQPALTLLRKYRRWEFWPAWTFYPPVAAMCAWLGLRYRGLSLPTVANPAFRNGGMVGESKIEVLQALMAVAPESVADGYLIAAGDAGSRLQSLEAIRADHAIGYPFVLKPNVGQRGAGFKLVTSATEAERYLARVKSDVIVQRYVSDPKEVGIFYYRLPGQTHGQIFAVTEKVFPTLVGDGKKTFDALLSEDERASLIAETYRKRFPEICGQVLKDGERVRLVEAGNHCQGCIFREGGHLGSPHVLARIDQISRALPGFFIGRYDVRYSSDTDLRRGKNFQIIELNGAASEATNIYDERTSLLSAYRTLYRQWELVYAIGRINRDRGHQTASIWQVWRDWIRYRRMAAAYPVAD